MTIASHGHSLGDRLRALRKARGFSSPRALADAIQGGAVTQATIENIERGRKPDPAVSDLLNLAWALRVPVAYLLAPLQSGVGAGMPNLAGELAALSAGEFESWLAGVEDGSYRARDSAERTAISELSAFRELHALRRELRRLEIVEKLDPSSVSSSRARAIEAQLSDLEGLLRAAGWDTSTN